MFNSCSRRGNRGHPPAAGRLASGLAGVPETKGTESQESGVSAWSRSVACRPPGRPRTAKLRQCATHSSHKFLEGVVNTNTRLGRAFWEY